MARELFAGPTPREPVALSRFAGEVIARLEQLTFPEARVPGATIDAQATARGLEALKADLDTKLSAVQDEVREAQLARTARDRAMATFDQTFGAIAGLYESLFRLSGEHELADRVRPSRRRPGKTEEGPDSPEPNPAPGR